MHLKFTSVGRPASNGDSEVPRKIEDGGSGALTSPEALGTSKYFERPEYTSKCSNDEPVYRLRTRINATAED